MGVPRMGLVVAVLTVVLAGTTGVGTAAATTLKPRTVLMQDINRVRQQYGLGAVRPSTLLHTIALRHSDDMILRDYFSHTSPSGQTLFDRIVSSGFVNGYSWVGGETLAWGSGTLAGPATTVTAWLGSPEHRAILLSSRWTRIGIARACGRFLGHVGACVWTADWVERW
ncbi:MAG TPA: CAP domain-containing protein [Gaiellales bacterium]